MATSEMEIRPGREREGGGKEVRAGEGEEAADFGSGIEALVKTAGVGIGVGGADFGGKWWKGTKEACASVVICDC